MHPCIRGINPGKCRKCARPKAWRENIRIMSNSLQRSSGSLGCLISGRTDRRVYECRATHTARVRSGGAPDREIGKSGENRGKVIAHRNLQPSAAPASAYCPVSVKTAEVDTPAAVAVMVTVPGDAGSV